MVGRFKAEAVHWRAKTGSN